MPREVISTVYKLNELEGGARERALSRLRATEIHLWNADYELAYHRDRLAELGYVDADIQYSGFYCQGDGASFTCKVNVPLWLEKNTVAGEHATVRTILDGGGELVVELVRHGTYHNDEYTVDVEFDLFQWNHDDGERDAWLAAVASLADAVLEAARDEMRAVYRELMEAYEYALSDEALADMAEANDYEFEFNGDLWG